MKKESRKHRQVALYIAHKEGTEYNSGEGADVNTYKRAIEIETPNTVADGLQQLQGYRKPVYIAGTNDAAVKKALELTKNTTVGVMTPRGKILKRSTRTRC